MTERLKTKPRKRAGEKISKQKSIVDAYLSANKNSFGQKQRAWVVFTDEDRIFWLRWLRPGYRHCFMIMNDDEHWLAVVPLVSCMEVTMLPSPPDFNLPEWICGQGQ